MAVFTAVAVTLMLCDLKEYKKSKADTFLYFTLVLLTLTGAGLYYGNII